MNKYKFFYLAWIASKVKAVTPVLPSGDATTAIPSVNNALPKGSGGSMGIPSGEKLTTKRRGHSVKRQQQANISAAVQSSSINK